MEEGRHRGQPLEVQAVQDLQGDSGGGGQGQKESKEGGQEALLAARRQEGLLAGGW